MKKISILFLICAAFNWMACSDDNEEAGLRLEADKESILADGRDQVKFKVFADGAEVTADAVVKEQVSGEVLVNGLFVTSVAGSYTFVAEYAGAKSEPVTVRAEKGEGFKKNVLVMKFTAIGCYACPQSEKAIRQAEKDAPGKVHPISIYGTLGQMKEFMIDEYINSFKKYFAFSEYPTVIIDHADRWNYGNGISDMVFEKALKAKADAGIAIATSWTGNELNVEVKIRGGKTLDYATNLVVAILENDLYAEQTGALTEEDNYHHHVVRHYLTDLYGEEYKIAKGTIGADKDYTQTFRWTPSVEFKKDNLEVMVYLLKSSGKSAVNCQTVTAGNRVDYENL